jgi:hypothetical protein
MLARMANILEQSSPIHGDAPMYPSNLPTANVSTVVTGLPTVHRRRYNSGVAASHATTAQITDGMELLEAWSRCDAEAIRVMNGDVAAARLKQGSFYLEAFSQQVETDYIYGSVADDEREFNGFHVRYGTLGESNNVIGCGGTGGGSVYSSILLVGWGEGKIYSTFPMNTVGGLQHKDWEAMPISTDPTDSDSLMAGGLMEAYTDKWCWNVGLVVEDWRYAVRIANILVSDLQGVTGTQAVSVTTNIIQKMSQAVEMLPNLGACKPALYMPRSVFIGFKTLALSATLGNVFKTEDVAGSVVTSFQGIPMRICDSMTYTEDEVTT